MQSAQYIRDSKWHRYSGSLLAAVWIAGLLLGASAARLSEYYIFSLMQQLHAEPLSIVGLLTQILVSMLFTVLAVILSKPGLLLFAALIKAFFLSYFLECMLLAGSEATALMYWLLSSAGALPAIALLYFWAQNIYKIRIGVARDLIMCMTVHLISGFAELIHCFEFL